MRLHQRRIGRENTISLQDGRKEEDTRGRFLWSTKPNQKSYIDSQQKQIIKSPNRFLVTKHLDWGLRGVKGWMIIKTDDEGRTKL